MRASLLALCLFLSSLPLARAQDASIYTDSLNAPGWENWSWATVNFANTSPVHSGSDSISVTCGSYQALALHFPGIDASFYTNLTFWINGGSSGGQSTVIVKGVLQGTPSETVTTKYYTVPKLATNAWQQIVIPLTAFGISNQETFDGFQILNNTGSTIPVFYVDDISLVAATSPAVWPASTVTVDAAANRHVIPPLIYGVCQASGTDLTNLNSTMNRNGGDNNSRYNWQLNCDNKGADYYFESFADSSSVPGERGDTFITTSKGAGAIPLLSIPMLPYVGKVSPSRGPLASFSTNKYGAQAAHDPYPPYGGNGVKPDGVTDITGNDPTDANTNSNPAFQQGWVQHIIGKWGYATNNGLRYYILDNEHSIWYSTHRDVHPVGATMNEILTNMVNFAGMIKSNDPDALVLGPEEWSWPGYINSGYDQQTSGSTDRNAHGGSDYIPWLLSQLYQTNLATGKRLLDVCSVHCYPQGHEGSDDVTPIFVRLRNRSTRQFWDTNYIDSSWIEKIIGLIPRLKSWTATNYPGTKTAVTEYNWGAEGNISGGIAQADIFGIFGRETGLDMATRWTVPTNGAPTYKAMQMYRNYDGHKSTFGDISVLAGGSNNPDYLSVFAAQRTNDSALTIMVIHKNLTGTMPVSINLSNYVGSGAAQVWHLNGTNNAITHLPDQHYTNGTLSVTLVPQSITLFIIPPRIPQLQGVAAQTDNQFQFSLNAEIGQTYVLQSSSDLTNWVPVSTNVLTSPQLNFTLPATNNQVFYRATLAQ